MFKLHPHLSTTNTAVARAMADIRRMGVTLSAEDAAEVAYRLEGRGITDKRWARWVAIAKRLGHK